VLLDVWPARHLRQDVFVAHGLRRLIERRWERH
jgi:hypothetical protein